MEKEGIKRIKQYFEEVETTATHKGYIYKVGDAITIVIVGTFCGFRNVNQIHQLAAHEKTREFLREKIGIEKVPCYWWLLCLLKILDPKSMSEHFTKWVMSYLPESLKGKTVSFDGKTIRSTDSMESYDNPLHIVSAQIAELGLTLGQEAVESKSNEIPATQRLIKMLKLKDCIVVADALNCQTETAKAIVEKEADYLLSVKDNQANLKKDIEDFIQDKDLRKTMSTAETHEKSRGRIEKRTAFVTSDTDWLLGKENWSKLTSIGAINTRFTTKSGESNEWHYYISSKKLTAEELLKHARAEWSVESMHWLLDVHFDEDFCRVEDENIQQILNIIRKIVINSLRLFKTASKSKKSFSNLMIDCLLDHSFILHILKAQN